MMDKVEKFVYFVLFLSIFCMLVCCILAIFSCAKAQPQIPPVVKSTCTTPVNVIVIDGTEAAPRLSTSVSLNPNVCVCGDQVVRKCGTKGY
jgi:hypothetical protein